MIVKLNCKDRYDSLKFGEKDLVKLYHYYINDKETLLNLNDHNQVKNFDTRG